MQFSYELSLTHLKEKLKIESPSNTSSPPTFLGNVENVYKLISLFFSFSFSPQDSLIVWDFKICFLRNYYLQAKKKW